MLAGDGSPPPLAMLSTLRTFLHLPGNNHCLCISAKKKMQVLSSAGNHSQQAVEMRGKGKVQARGKVAVLGKDQEPALSKRCKLGQASSSFSLYVCVSHTPFHSFTLSLCLALSPSLDLFVNISLFLVLLLSGSLTFLFLSTPSPSSPSSHKLTVWLNEESRSCSRSTVTWHGLAIQLP